MQDKLYYTSKQTADILGVTTNTLRRWEKKGYFIAEHRIGLRQDRRYSQEQIDQLKLKMTQDGQDTGRAG